MQPGVYRGIPNDEYHSGPGISKSGLDLIRDSPARYRAARTGLRPRTSTKAQLRGTAIHAMVLEPELVARTYALPFNPPADALATVEQLKAALSDAGVAFKSTAKKSDLEALARAHLPDVPIMSDERASYEAQNQGKTIIEPEEWARLEDMLAAIRAHPAAMKLLSGDGEAELSAYWDAPIIDPETGEQLADSDGLPATRLARVRPDFWRKDGILVDLKSTSSGGASLSEFARSILNWRYDVQHAMYMSGARQALESRPAGFEDYESPREFVFVAVEADACVVDGVSMGVAVYRLGNESAALGLLKMREDLLTLYRCEQLGRWPGYSDRIEHIELPHYAFPRAE